MTNKLGIIGGSGLYDVEEFKDKKYIDCKTPWGKPSDQILKIIYEDKEVFFLPRHGRGHFISHMHRYANKETDQLPPPPPRRTPNRKSPTPPSEPLHRVPDHRTKLRLDGICTKLASAAHAHLNLESDSIFRV